MSESKMVMMILGTVYCLAIKGTLIKFLTQYELIISNVLHPFQVSMLASRFYQALPQLVLRVSQSRGLRNGLVVKYHLMLLQIIYICTLERTWWLITYNSFSRRSNTFLRSSDIRHVCGTHIYMHTKLSSDKNKYSKKM